MHKNVISAVAYFAVWIIVLAFCLRDTCFSRIFSWLLRRRKAILIKSSLLCKCSNKFAPKYKFFASNNEAILTYRPLKNTFFTFYKRYSAIFKFLDCFWIRWTLSSSLIWYRLFRFVRDKAYSRIQPHFHLFEKIGCSFGGSRCCANQIS